MRQFLETKRAEIAELCRTHHVQRLSVFASAVRDDFDAARSDIDVVVDFQDMPIQEYSDTSSHCVSSWPGTFSRPVDLLTWKSIRNPYILHEVQAEHVDLCAA